MINRYWSRQHRNKLCLHYFDVFVSLDYRPVDPPADPGLATPASNGEKGIVISNGIKIIGTDVISYIKCLQE